MLQDRDVDTFAANEMLGRGPEEREYGVAAQMLAALGVIRIDLITNNPEKVDQLSAYGIELRSVQPMAVYVNPHNQKYQRDKALLARHQFRGLLQPDPRVVGELG